MPTDKCPKCRAKLKVSEDRMSCRRCGYTKHLPVSNWTKHLMEITYGAIERRQFHDL